MKSDSIIIHLPPPFNYYRLISDSDHLHFGLWPDETSKKTSVEEALQNMIDRLVSYLPEPPARLLDVGCGLGLAADILNSKGFDVIAIAPSPELIEYAIERYGSDGAAFRVADYFDSDESIFGEEGYDALFFQESLQYLQPLNKVMRKARYLLRDKGVIIIGDEVCYDQTIKNETSVHMSRDIYAALSEGGFRIISNDKVGKNVIPTCELAIDRLTENFGRILSSLDDPNGERNLRFFLEGWRKQKFWHESGQFGYEIFAGKKDPFFIRSYVEGDEHEILAIFNEVFKTDRSLDHWYWKFRDNPYGSHRICVGISGEGGIVSQYAGHPVPFCSTIEDDTKPRCFLTLHAGDTFTSPEVRRIGLGKTGLLARTTFYYYAKFLEGFVPFAFGFNTATIKKLGERFLGYSFGEPVVLWRKDLSTGSFKRPRFFERIFSGFRVEEILSVDDEWDDFFGRVCPAYEFLVKRDATYLKWRYLECPDKDYRIFAVRKKGALVGWSVSTPKDSALIWGDALFDKSCLESLSFLLGHILEAYFADAETIEAWFSRNPEWWVTHLQSIGFETSPEPDGLTLCYRTFWNDMMDEHSVTEKLKSHFYYTWGDSDLF